MTKHKTNKFSVSSCGISDIGSLRTNNEDVFATLADQKFFVLADGMGGHLAGEVAAREAAFTLCELVERKLKGKKKSFLNTIDFFDETIRSVNAHVFKLGKSSNELRGMGTTLCTFYVHDEGVIYGHVGDSRIYRFREGELKLLTKDHSLLRELIDKGQIREENASEFQYKNIITRAIGTEAFVEPSIAGEIPEDKDIYLLCSDGLSDLLNKKELELILKSSTSLSEAAGIAITMAKEKGGYDNVTILLIQITK